MKNLLMCLLAGVLASCLPEKSSAQCDKCIEDQNCPLRTSGPLSKEDIGEAGSLLTELKTTKETLAGFRDAKDSSEASFRYYVPIGSDNYCYANGEMYQRAYNNQCAVGFNIGKVSDTRDMVNTILKARIQKAACRLRAIGVDIPRP